MSRVEVTKRAERELRSTTKRIRREAGPHTALHWVDRLEQAVMSRHAMPQRTAFETATGRRRLVVRPYLIFYDVLGDGRIRVNRVVD